MNNLIVNDDDFKRLDDPQVAFKRPAWLTYQLAEEERIVETKEGTQIARQGDAIVTGIKGERWPIPKDKHDGYDFKEENGVTSISKKLALVAVAFANEPMNVKLSWSDNPLEAKSDDAIVRYGANDFGVVDREIYEKTYASLKDTILEAKTGNQEALTNLEGLAKDQKNSTILKNNLANCNASELTSTIGLESGRSR